MLGATTDLTVAFGCKQFPGGEWRKIKAGLEDISVFAEAKVIIPLAPKLGRGGIENPKERDLYIIPDADNHSELYLRRL